MVIFLIFMSLSFIDLFLVNSVTDTKVDIIIYVMLQNWVHISVAI